MNYQHSYHAGSIADVFKHITLIQLLKSLHKKPGAFTYFDTHAGNAIYDLQYEHSQKTLEYQTGIGALWDNQKTSDLAINDYLQIIQHENTDGQLKFYPGSGLIASQFLRPQDEAILCELHPEVYQNLKHYFKKNPQMHIHHRNGYEALTALIPGKNKRGLVLIDPPFEINNEFQEISTVLEKMQIRWSNGIYAIWFPIKQYEVILDFYNSLKNLIFKNVLVAELWSGQESDDNRLKGSGLAIINPPWKLDETLQSTLLELVKILKIIPENNIRINWLVNN